MARRALSFKARGLLRECVEQQGGRMEMADTPEREELYKAGLIVRGSSTTTFEATAAGITHARQIVQTSGDGPEDLKAMFAPLFRGPGR